MEISMAKLVPFILARLQFAANSSFQILFPAMLTRLCWVLPSFAGLFTINARRNWEHAYTVWVKIFALAFTVGVVSGIPMTHAFCDSAGAQFVGTSFNADPCLAATGSLAFTLWGTLLAQPFIMGSSCFVYPTFCLPQVAATNVR